MPLLALYGAAAAPQDVRLQFWTDPIILEFLAGVYVALAFRRGLRFGAASAALLAAVGAIGCLHAEIPPGDRTLWRLVWAGAPAACLVLALACGPALRAGRFTTWAVALGDASYSLYLIHPFVIRPLRVLWARTPAHFLPATGFLLAALIASCLAALAVHAGVERPLTRLAQSWRFPRRRGRSALLARIDFALRRPA
jgi:peptidoglycan/LPS O-acetylase OafA/YrhL